MGRRHIQVVKKLGLDLAAVYDKSREALKTARKENGLAEAVLATQLEAVFAGAPDCVIIATTADSHCELTCLAAEKGSRFILVEKPMAVSLAECDKMIAACEKNGARMAVNHQMRFLEQYSHPRALLESDVYGGMRSMTVVAGNFGVSMNGTHYVEAFRYMAGENPTEVTAWFSSDLVSNPRGAQFEDRAGCIRVTSASGKRMYLDISSDQGHGVIVTYAARNGFITVNELTGEMTTSVREAQYRDLPTTRYGMPAENGREKIAPVEVIDSTALVLAALLEDKDNVTAEQGRLAVEVLAAAYASAEDGSRPVKLDGSLDKERKFPWA